MSSIIRTTPCRASSYSVTRWVDPWRHCLDRDRGMILCLNQDESDFFIPPGWGRYMYMIQNQRRIALATSHERNLDIRKNILTRRDLPIVPYDHAESKILQHTKHHERYLVMRWDLDIVLINPKRVLDNGSYHYRSSATNLPHDKITRIALLIGERGLTQWAYKWLDLHLPSMTSLREVLFVDTNALSYLQSTIFDLSSGGPSDDLTDPWEDRSSAAELLKTFSLAPPLPRKQIKATKEQEAEELILQHGTALTSTYDGARN